MPAKSTHGFFLFLLLALCAFPLNAALYGQPSTPSKELGASSDSGPTIEVERAPRTRFSELHVYNQGLSFTDCLAHYAKEASGVGSVLPSQIAIIRKICDRQLEAVLKPISVPVQTNDLTQTRRTGVRLGTRQNRKPRTLSELLQQGEKATLQYIFSRLKKTLGKRLGECYPPINSKPKDFDGSKKQKRLASIFLNRIKNADNNTFNEICRKLRKLLQR